MSEAATNKKTPIYKVLYFQVICAIVIGIVLGAVWPEVGEKMKPFGDGFIRLIKMIIAPVIFGCDRHCRHGEYEEGRENGRPGTSLF